jgi:protoheme IX farnesyltransferase
MTATSDRFTDLLTAATVATYAVVALGATIASRDAATCGTWPGCAEPGLLAIGHRIAAVVAAGTLLLAAWYALRLGVSRRLRLLLGVAVAAFPVQVALGGAIATGVGEGLVGLHLLLAIGIFGLLLATLVLALEETTGSDASTQSDASGVAYSEEIDVDPEPATDGGAVSSGSTSADPLARPLATARAYVELTKPRLMWLLCLLALGGVGLAALEGAAVDGVTVVATLAGGVLAIGASGAANHVFERDRDERMDRTADRPLASGLVSVRGATAFSLGLAGASVAVLWTLTTPMATLLTVVAMVYYAVAYTVLLKPRTRWNTVVGGGAGALPAVIGWAAVTGGIGLPAVLLAVVVFCWTPAHFYNLALAYREDYAAGGYPMVPVVLGARSTRRRIAGYLGVTAVATGALVPTSTLGSAFAVVAVLAAGGFLYAVVAQYRERTDAAALRTFHASNAYLAAMLVAIVFEGLVAVA